MLDCDVLRAEAARDADGTSGNDDESAGRGVVLRAECRNNSTFDTMQVLEVYCRDLQSPNAVPNTSLCAFRKIMLTGSSESTVEIRIDGRAFSSVNDDGERVYDSDRYILYVGFGQPDIRTEELTGKRCVSVEISFD
jgi:beta-glucosidase